MKFTSPSGRKAVALLGGLTLLISCSKETGVAPKEPNNADRNQTSPWTAFVQRVSEGVNSDPLGQYVAKSVQVADGTDRLQRPKMNAEDRSWASIQSLLAATRGPDVPYIQPIEPTCDDYSYCGGGGGGGGGTPTVYSTFTSSEGQSLNGDPFINPDNYILDVELAKSSYASVDAKSGYTKLSADLNKGAGGKFIFLTFTRSSFEQGHSGKWPAQHPLTRIWADSYSSSSDHDAHGTGLDEVWNPTWGSFYLCDLNDGAGGKYIYAHMTKDIQRPAGWQSGTPPKVPIKEVGILSGNSSSIQPPAGWVRDGKDLNEGAGGDFIYLCTKY
ncbi:hypothetical protein LGH70_12920 [Hymenobacter sp. BT635]|uniref:MABP domain-containing protein n=1 Tax=Hymenobacter nitidus TaxID=2880929 RepID=A0ABS8ADK7_9BACT|nr:hypothetical protein [Hymenobacter nitidus]MCB2378495.1 hypothetical protein [Hymenobacter nitidus]